jgi:hypothetical protein
MTLETRSDTEVAKELEYLIGISYVGGPEYLKRALASIGDKHLEHTFVINSSEPLEMQSTWDHRWSECVPIVPLSHTQTHNYLQVLASGRDCLIVVHNDAECEPDTIDKLLELRLTLPKKWGVVFTNYDAVAMYNPKAFAAIGGWDWRLFPSYYSDNDVYRRLTLAGWTLHESGLHVKHEGSHVINKVNKWLKFYNHTLLHDQARQNYVAKWGGPPGEETYTIPFDLPRGPYPDE